MADRLSKETIRALKSFAIAVKTVGDLFECPSLDARGKYLATEYLKEMEDMLKEQLVTVVPTQDTRERILMSTGLDYLVEDVELYAQEQNEDG